MKKDIEQCSIKQVNQKYFVNLENLLLILQMMLGIAVNCEISDQIIGSFTEKLNEVVLDDLMQITKDILPRFCKKDFADLDVSQITGDSNRNDSLTLADLQSPPQLRASNVNVADFKIQSQSMTKIQQSCYASQLQSQNHNHVDESAPGVNMYASQNAITPANKQKQKDELDKSDKMKLSQMSSMMAKHSKSQHDQMDNEYLGSVDIME